jgi:uncharacterized HAD superfamily protein
MRIGIDLDDVVFEFARELLIEYNFHHGTYFTFEDIFSYYFSDVFKTSGENIVEFMKKYFGEEKVRNLPLCELAKESIFSLAEKHDIYFITSRVYKEGTKESLDLHFSNIPFNLIFSSNPYAGTSGQTKGALCLENGIDFMIEDSKEHGEECASKGIKTLLIHKPWNIQANHENLIRVNNWREILQLIEKENGH